VHYVKIALDVASVYNYLLAWSTFRPVAVLIHFIKELS